MFEKIKEINDIEIIHVTDPRFNEFGRVINGIDCTELLVHLSERQMPESGNVYIASDEALEKLPIAETFKNEFFGGLPIQIGYCNGNSHQLNALEYHKCPELNIATTDIVLFLGKTSNIKNDTFSVEDVQAFYIPKETLVELDGTTMHFAPCKISERGFKTLVVLPKGTNEDFSENQLAAIQSKTLFKVSKWLLAHPENEILIGRGGYPALKGENLKLNIIGRSAQ